MAQHNHADRVQCESCTAAATPEVAFSEWNRQRNQETAIVCEACFQPRHPNI